MRIEIKAYGNQVMSRKYSELAHRASDVRPGFLAVYERFRELEQLQFERMGAGPHGPWEPLKPSTVKRKARLGLDPRILHEKLVLRPSLTRRGSRFAMFRTAGGTLVMGTRDPKAERHQRGTPGGQMPARPPIDLWPQDKIELVGIMQDYLVDRGLK